jgi:hypothetical protein
MLHIKKNFPRYSLACLIIIVLLETPSILFASGEPISLYALDAQNRHFVEFDFYPSGYSDGFYWGPSARHLNWNEGYSHEMLSGEWAAGIYYNGIHDNKTQWLADWFKVPNWQTHTSFHQNSNYQVWNHRTAQSEVNDLNIKVTIDSNLVDLGANGYASLE